ncbi:HxlR family transcriptional regulator [Novosphingobium barchaimii LL02]|uniref:HxlR family transcriptional regulator n=1 Tax=Novosphingobium barchaimii LL02 TaxID=1114963 RepID=A0A0J7XVS8_9SPHN|nr:helix-turn-helix domain-containing protein [Novosphingobium barchaimii]KMS55223.1 HxlR family transcriptional regulator [Novosphingobium barchaimii LL02]
MKLTTFDEADQPVAAAAAPKHDPASKDCRLVGDILSRVGDKWSMLVVMTLLDGALHFNELKRAIQGVSQQMLSRTVRALERDGLVARTVHVGVPVRVEYALSDLGRSLSGPVKALSTWAVENGKAIEGSRKVYDGLHDQA